jgi:hypothetical protein
MFSKSDNIIKPDIIHVGVYILELYIIQYHGKDMGNTKSAYQKAFDAGARAVQKLKKKAKSGTSRKAGLMGRSGAIIGGTAPLALPTLRVLGLDASRLSRHPDMPAMSRVVLGAYEWLNGWVGQFGFDAPFKSVSVPVNKTGYIQHFKPNTDDIKGVVWPIEGTAFLTIGLDRLFSWIASKGTMIPGTRQYAIGTKG